MEKRDSKFGVVSLQRTIALFLAIAPVLDPYVFLSLGSSITIKLNDVFLIFIGMLCLQRMPRLSGRTGLLCKWVLGLLFISGFGNLYSSTNGLQSLKIAFVWFMNAFFLAYIWKYEVRDSFFKYVQIIASICAIIVLLQFVFGNLGIPIWDGRIPGLALGKYDGWSGYIDINTRDIRPNGIFQEASYVGIYLSVAYAQAFKEGKMKSVLLYSIAMLLTTSVVSIILLITITFYLLMVSKKIDLSSKMTRRILVLALFLIGGIVYYSATNEALGNAIGYVLRRITNIRTDLQGTRMGSTKFRLLGNIYLFEQYSLLQKIIGVGISQYAQLFNVVLYSNVWVTTILNSGIIGLLFLLVCVIGLYKRTNPSDKVFFIIFILVLSADYQWFSWYFFYMITACILQPEQSLESENKQYG